MYTPTDTIGSPNNVLGVIKTYNFAVNPTLLTLLADRLRWVCFVDIKVQFDFVNSTINKNWKRMETNISPIYIAQNVPAAAGESRPA